MGLDLSLYIVKPIKTIEEFEKLLEWDDEQFIRVIPNYSNNDITTETEKDRCFKLNYNDMETSTKKKFNFDKTLVAKDGFFYTYKLEEIVYQRKGLNEKGWKIIEEIGNCNFCDDYFKIEKLVNEGGLSKEFLEKWLSGKVVFEPWW